MPEADYELYKEVVNAGYRFHDLMLGTVLQLAGDDTTVMIVSDHGFHNDHLRVREIPNEPAGPADEHRQFGILAMRGPGLKQDELLFGASLLDVTPTVLALFGLPVGEDMDGKPLLNAFVEAPAIGTVPSWDDIAGDSGRHPAGVQVDPVDQAEALRQLVELGYIDRPDTSLEQASAQTVRELRYNLARDLQDSRRLRQAAALYSELRDAWPDEHRFGVHLLECRLQLGQPEAAREILEQLQGAKQRIAEAACQELAAIEAKLHDVAPAAIATEDRRQWQKLRRLAGTNHQTVAFLRGRVLAALVRIGGHEKRHTGSHRTLARTGWPDVVFAFPDGEKIGPRPVPSPGKRPRPAE